MLNWVDKYMVKLNLRI